MLSYFCQKCKKNGGSPTSFWREHVWLRREWIPSRQLVCAIGEACLIAFMNLFSVRAVTSFSYTVEPGRNHFLWLMLLPCPHLLNRGSSKFSCLFTIWLKKDLNLAQMILPVPHIVVVADQYRWFLKGLIHSVRLSQPFCFAITVRTFRSFIYMCCP